MSTLKLATWNVNSIRSRLDRVLDWLDRRDVDVLAIQETKCRDDQFPEERFAEHGYEVAHVGQGAWNGVAIASRVGLDDVEVGFEGQPGFDRHAETALIPMPVVDARAIAATCAGVRVWSLYVPNGRALTDPHYTYKLEWLAALHTQAAGWLSRPGRTGRARRRLEHRPHRRRRVVTEVLRRQDAHVGARAGSVRVVPRRRLP